MIERKLRVLLAALTLLGGAALAASCSVAIDPGITYRPCLAGEYEEPFDGTEKELLERCWTITNASGAPSSPAERDEVFVDDGDLVIRGKQPQPEDERDLWSGTTAGPVAHQTLTGDFLVVTRVEAVDLISGDHCIPEDNMAGLFVRHAEDAAAWATFLLGPFTPDPPTGVFSCSDADLPQPPARGVVSSPSWGPLVETRGEAQAGIGFDLEADLAACRVGDALVFYYRAPSSTPTSPVWVRVGVEEYDVGSAPVEVGLTVASKKESIEIEGHFTWVEYVDHVGADGCAGALAALSLPVDT